MFVGVRNAPSDPRNAETVSLVVPMNTVFLTESLKKLLYSCTISLIIEDKQMAAERLTGWSGESQCTE